MTKRKAYFLAISVITVTAIAVRLWFQVIPRGATSLPYILASCDPQVLVSPNGEHRVTVVFNDAGAAHSGNFWTWVIAEDWLFGKRVVAEGYSGDEARYATENFPLKWLDGGNFVVRFVTGRRADPDEHVSVRGSL